MNSAGQSLPSVGDPSGGFAPWPAGLRGRSKVTAQIVLLSVFACLSVGVFVMSAAVAVHERVLGAYSLPSSIRENLRFACDQEGRLILRCFDKEKQEWRDAGLDDLEPPAVDMVAARSQAWSRANTRGSYMSTRQALAAELRRPTPPRAHAYSKPNGHAGRLSIQANFFVTDGLPHVETVSLLDLIETNGDPVKAWARSFARTM